MKTGLSLLALGVLAPALPWLWAQAAPPGAPPLSPVNWASVVLSLGLGLIGLAGTLTPILLAHSRKLARANLDLVRANAEIARLNGFAKKSMRRHDATEADRRDLRQRQDEIAENLGITTTIVDTLTQDPEALHVVLRRLPERKPGSAGSSSGIRPAIPGS